MDVIFKKMKTPIAWRRIAPKVCMMYGKYFIHVRKGKRRNFEESKCKGGCVYFRYAI